MGITFLYPEALLIGLLLIVLYWKFVKNKNGWRTAMVIVLALLLAFPSLRVRSKSIDLYMLLDRSRSIPEEGIAKQAELLELVSGRMEPGDRVSVVTFNEKGYVEQAPSPGPAVREMAIPYSADASDLTDGLAAVLSMASENRQNRVLLLSDGEFTGQSPMAQAQVARQMNVPIYMRDLKRLNVQNLFVSGADTEEKLMANEPFRVLFRVNSTVDMPGRYRIYRNGRIVGNEQDNGWRAYDFRAGENRIAFTDSVSVTGIQGYRIEVESTPADRELVKTDNVGEKFVSIIGERPILVVNNDGQPDNVTSVLSAGGLPMHIVGIGSYRMDINQLTGYKGVILNNVPILNMPKSQIDDLRDFVTQEGGGLLVCGGNRSFGAGGYYRTALEEVMPVSLEDRQQSKKLTGAFSFVLDRSGSMMARVPSGETKMDMANAAVVEALNLLSGGDSISVIAVDSSAHIIVPQQPVANPGSIAAQVRSIESMGGGIFVYTGLVAAGTQIAQSGIPDNKHVLLFADAADAEEPGDYEKLIEKFTDSGISVSVVGLGRETDVDAEFLKDIARRGNGNVYFTEDPQQLTQFFTADTIQYTRKNFIEDPAPMKILPGAFTMSAEQQWSDFSAAGYNLLFPRESAEVAIMTANGDDSPVLAFWQRGVGRAATLALDTAGEFSQKPDFPDIVLSAARWVMGSNVNDTFQVQTETEGNYARITMEVSDEERAKMGQARLLMFAPDGSTVERPLQWDSWNRLSSSVRLTQSGAWRGVIQVGEESYRVGPVSMPVSPEFAYRGDEASGRETLQQIASMTGGQELVDINPLFERRSATVAFQPLVVPLLVLLLLLLLAEIAEARFGMLHSLKQRFAGGGVGQRVVQLQESLSESWQSGRDQKKLKRRKARETKQPGDAPRRTAAPLMNDGAPSAAKKPKPGKATAAGDQAPAAPVMDDLLSRSKARARRSMKEKQPPKN